MVALKENNQSIYKYPLIAHGNTSALLIPEITSS